MKVVMVGGSPEIHGGMEVFCTRTVAALRQHSDLEVAKLQARTGYLRLARVPALLEDLRALGRQMQSRPDCVWVQYTNLPDLLFVVAAKWWGGKVMVTPHLGTAWLSQRSPILRTISYWLLKTADRFALLSRTQDSEIRLPRDTPRSYIRTFLPPEIWDTYAPAAPTPHLRLLHAARLSAGKGTFLFLELCRELDRRKVAFVAHLVGKGDPDTMSRIHAFVTEHGLEGKVVVTGFVPDEELLALMRSADVLVHLSTIDSYPLTVLESIAYGTFPVCLDLAGVRDMVAQYDGTVVPENAAVEEAVRFLSEHTVEQLRTRAGAAAPRIKTDYAWKSNVAAVQDALSATLHQAR